MLNVRPARFSRCTVEYRNQIRAIVNGDLDEGVTAFQEKPKPNRVKPGAV